MVASIGVDVGSTTVKAVVLSATETRASVYLRHRGDPIGAVRRALSGLVAAETRLRVAVTGSAGRALSERWGAPHVHEVSAAAAAVRRRHPEARALVDLGGQDAKLVVLARDRAHMTMNDRCAAGTGVTLDRCLFRLGVAPDAARAVRFDPARARRVSSKCGVFAETDLVNLRRAGVSVEDLVISLADAIVAQSLAVLARGMTPEPQVILLGGPHVHLPVLVEAWRHRLGELWRARGVPPGEVRAPDGALLYAAMGAAELGATRGSPTLALDELLRRLDGAASGEAVRLDRPLVRAAHAGERRLSAAGAGAVRLVGIDAGSTMCKLVVTDESGRLLGAATRKSTDPVGDARALMAEVSPALDGATVAAVGVTGYGAAVLAPLVAADAQVVETVAHARAARAIAPDAEVICDVGGQDIKVVVLDRAGAIRDFRLSSQCAAGIGMLLEATARELDVPLADYAPRAFAARRAPWFGDACTVFLDSNRVTFQKQGFTPDEILAGLSRALPRVVWTQVMNGTAPASLGRVFVLQGGVQRNRAAVAAQIDYLTDEVPGARVLVHPHPSEAGAIGAALAAWDVRRGVDAPRPTPTLDAEVRVRSDDETRCRLCPSQCPRSFVEVSLPHRTALHVVGNGCAEGAEAHGGSAGDVARRKRAATPNLLDEEVRLFFHPRHAGRPLRRPPRPVRIGVPRVLSLYRAAPLFRAYLGALGLTDLVFSPVTSEALWRAGASHGANDPCFPVKVVLAHVHHLLHEVHDRGRPLDAIFLPHFTHAMTPVRHSVDTASCPVIAATPALVRAAFGDALARRNIRLLDPWVTVTEPQLLRKQMWEGFRELTGASEDESRQAVKAGAAACQWVDDRLNEQAQAILDRVEREPGKGAVLVVGRPYHSDPGLNHRVGEELQAIGFPVLTVRSMPRDEAYLRRLFRDELAAGTIADPFDVRDLAPEAANSGIAERLFAARIAARHGKLGVVDLSNFKCGQDSPGYAPMRELLERAGVALCTLHDLDETRPVTSLRVRLKTFQHAMAARGLLP